MRITLLLEREAADSTVSPWVIDATDELSIGEHNGAYPVDFQAMLDEDPVNRRVLHVDIPAGALHTAFAPAPAVTGTIADT